MELKRLYFVDKDGTKHFIMQSTDLQALHKACFNDRNKRKITSSYIRQWLTDDTLWIDYGSWTEFYCIHGVTPEELMQ